MTSILHSPFKFLDPYDRNDLSIFFGRDEEVETLYQHIHKNRLVLVYGTSGTGKTSIVQCGLMNRMYDTDWYPLFVRRGDHLVDSLHEATAMAADPKAGNGTTATALSGGTQYKQAPQVLRARNVTSDAPGKIYESLKAINVRYLRPVYLIFDQFEELLIMGSDDEKKTIIEIIDHILSDPELQFCNLLFIMREEFFAGLSQFEKEIPDFCDRRLRIEPMNHRNVEEVIKKSCAKFNIRLEKEVENAKEIIAVLSEKQVVSLPYLQIYLDQLWRTVYMNTPDKVEPPDSIWPILHVNSTVIKKFGSLQDVLDRFMHERIHVIQEELQFPEIEDDFVANVLDAFVTNEGTKRPIPYARVNNGIWFTGLVPPYLQGRSSVLMTSLLTELEKNKILRSDGQTYELAHDILAGLIDNRRTEEQRRTGFTEKQILSRYEGFKNGASELLSAREIASYEPFIKRLNLPAEVIDFFKTSVNVRHRELKQEESQKKRQKIWRLGWIIGALLLVVILVGYFNNKRLTREFNRNESLVYMGFDLADKDAATALGLFGIFQQKVYGEDTSMLNLKLKETMQLQDAQALFARWHYDLPYVKVEPIDIDISDDGKYMVYNVNQKEFRDSVRTYILSTINGETVRQFDSVQYACFANGGNILVISRSGVLVDTSKPKQMTKAGSKPQYRRWRQAMLYDCDKKQRIPVPFETGQQLYGPDDITLFSANEQESYHVRVLANGNLLIPYLNNGRDQLMLLHPDGRLISRIPSISTVTTSRDGKLFMHYSITPNYTLALQIFSDNGELRREVLDEFTFGDFTEDGALLWGNRFTCYFLDGSDTLTYDAPENATIDYAYGNLSKGRIALNVSMNETTANYVEHRKRVIVAHIANGEQQFLRGAAIGVDLDKGYIITQADDPAGTAFRPGTDTLYRYDLSKPSAPVQYLVPAGIETAQFNRKTGDLLVFTRSNQLFVLDNQLQVKKGLKLTSNDTYGMARGGSRFYYARDRYLTVFDNDSLRLNVFDEALIWPRITGPGSPVKPITDKKRIRELGLHFK
ncbi:ATP-binding protein [Chitinophaga sp.]|uniref:ATP-binding protein n=1 Tax=Chitinophaga sp. TaxID=1869181 RepID=UPI0026150F33|nr:ATP-binding protein [uncultured Chitinophaga sp.]